MPATAAHTTQSAYVYYDPFLGSRLFETRVCEEEIRSRTLTNSQIDKHFLRLSNEFVGQFDHLNGNVDSIGFEGTKTKFAQSCSALLELKPDAFTFELTHEKSILYTFKKNDYTLFIEHFWGELEDGEDEAIVSVYKGKDKLPSKAGSLASCLIEINNIFEGNRLFVELPLNEVPF